MLGHETESKIGHNIDLGSFCQCDRDDELVSDLVSDI